MELIFEDGTTCTLPSLPQGREGLTQAGLVACGGYTPLHPYTSCITFSAGNWTTTHTLSTERGYHVSWASYPGGVLLLGGYSYLLGQRNAARPRSTELLSPTSSTTTPQFRLAYDTQ